MRNVIVLLAVFVAFEWAVDRVASPFQGADKIEKKFAYFAAHKDEFDCVFIGSSRVMNQISPRVFDQTMAAAGHPCRSINLGYAAMFLPESALLVDRVRALHPARLRTMVIELSTHTPRRDEDRALTAREIYWHRPVGTALACAAVMTDPSPTFSMTERAEQLWRQWSILARCLLHLDNGSGLLEHLLATPHRRATTRRPSTEVLGPDLDGFIPLVTTLGQGKTGVFKTGGSAIDLGDYQASVAALRAGGEALSPAPAVPEWGAAFGQTVFRALVRGQVSTLKGAGIEPVYFIGPVTTREQPMLDLATQDVIPKLLAFNDPAAYPKLYRPELRADRYHLNARGAEILTLLLAQRLAAPAPPAR